MMLPGLWTYRYGTHNNQTIQTTSSSSSSSSSMIIDVDAPIQQSSHAALNRTSFQTHAIHTVGENLNNTSTILGLTSVSTDEILTITKKLVASVEEVRETSGQVDRVSYVRYSGSLFTKTVREKKVVSAERRPIPSSSNTSNFDDSNLLLNIYKPSSKVDPLLRERRNLEKAVDEHIKRAEVTQQKVIHKENIFLKRSVDQMPRECKYGFHKEQGQKKIYKNAHFISVLPIGCVLFGMFDGKSEVVASSYAAENFQSIFERKLKESPKDIPTVMKKTMLELDSDIKKVFAAMETAVCIGFIDPSAILHVATVGDSEIKVFREVENEIHCIPLSCVRVWSIFKDKVNFGATPKRRPPDGGVWQVSCTLGNRFCNDYEKRTEIVAKPKTTAFALQTGDIILNANAGLWNFVSDVDLIEHVLKPNWSEPGKIAEATTQYALKTSVDNISVIVVQCS